MRVFLAGGISGNLNPVLKRVAKADNISWKTFMEVAENEGFLAGQNGLHKIIETPGIYRKALPEYKPHILESFFYADETTEKCLPLYGDFLLDSGAFTFMTSKKGAQVQWEDYIDRYAEFINRNKVEKFFELDIDSEVGYAKVKEYRQRLEKATGRACIPVWHISRGHKEFLRMCDEYSYVAIGGIVSREILPAHYSAFPKLIKEAHERGCKIHGLGFTRIPDLPKYHFDSVDSTAWTTGNRFGFVYKFHNGDMKKIKAPEGKCLGDARGAALNNFIEWCKFQKYAEENL